MAALSSGGASGAAGLTGLDALILDTAVKLGAGVRRNGKVARWTIDCRDTLLRAEALEQIGRELWRRLRPYEPEAVGGPTIAADPLIAAVMLAALAEGVALRGFMIRREPKRLGMTKQVEGPELAPGTRVAVVDDVINRGRSIQRALTALEPLAVEVVVVGAIVGFEAAGEEWLGDCEIPVERLTTLVTLGLRRAAAEPPVAPIVRSLSPDDLRAKRLHRCGACGTSSEYALVGEAGELGAFELPSGRQLWRRRLGRSLSLPPVLAGDVVLQGCETHLAALSIEDGKLLWLCPFSNRLIDGPILAGDRAAVVERCGQGTILDLDSGRPAAVIRTPGLEVMRVLASEKEFVFLRNDGGAVVVSAAAVMAT